MTWDIHYQPSCSLVMIVVDVEVDYVKSSTFIEHARAKNEFTLDPVNFLTDSIRELGDSSGGIRIELECLLAYDFEVLGARLLKAESVECEKTFREFRITETEDEIDLMREFGLTAEEAERDVSVSVHLRMNEDYFAISMAKGFFARGGEKMNILAIGASERLGYVVRQGLALSEP